MSSTSAVGSVGSCDELDVIASLLHENVTKGKGGEWILPVAKRWGGGAAPEGRGGEAATSRNCPSVSASRCHLPMPAAQGRSEEHTSELQSLMRISYAVFFLKKNK